MIKLVRGEYGDLEGKVTAYGRFEGNLASFVPKELTQTLSSYIGDELNLDFNKIIACYGSLDVLDIIERAGIPYDQGKQFLEHLSGDKPEMENILKQGLKAIPLLFESEEDVMKSSGDIIYVGKWSNPFYCIGALDKSLEIYSMHLSEQKSRESGIVVPQNDIKIKPKIEEKIDPTNIGPYIVHNYIGRMMDAKKRGDEQELTRLSRRLVNETSGMHYSHYIGEVCGIISKGRKEDLPLVEAYVGIIQAIGSEQYKEAAKFRDRIKELVSKP